MAVDISNGSLSFVSILDNSDFQAKSLQDIKLIQLRLQLTGDTSGIEKYDEAVRVALAQEIELRTELAKILQDAKIQTQGFVNQVEQQTGSKTVFTESAEDVQALQNTLNTFAETGNVALSGIDDSLKTLNSDFEAGKISATQFKEGIDQITASQAAFNEQVSKSNVSSAIPVIPVVPEASSSTLSGPLQSLPGATELNAQLENVNLALDQVQKQYKEGVIGLDEYQTATTLLTEKQQALTGAIQQFNDVQSENIVSTNSQTSTVGREINAYHELLVTLAELQEAQKNPLTPTADLPLIARQIQETQAGIKQFANAGKVGFDEFGNAVEQATVSQGRFGAAVSRVTDLGNIGARVVTQFARQIISLGVGLLSITIGAKAIESLVNYISNLDTFTGRLDIARQSLEAFQAAELDADKTAAPQIANLEILYDKTQDVTASIKDRVAAAEALRDQFPAEFQNSTALAIVNGKLSSSYDSVKNSILDLALAQAASGKVTEEATKILNAQTAIADALALKNKNIATAQGLPTQVNNPNSDAVLPSNPYQDAIDNANANYNKTLKEQNENINVSKGVIKNLEGYITNVSKSASDLKSANKLLGDQLENFNSLISGTTDLKQLQNIKNALQTKLDSLAPNDAQIATVRADLQKVDDLIKQTYTVKPTSTHTATDPAIALLASQTSLLQNIDALKNKYAAKDTERDNEALAEIDASYKKQYDAIVAQNVKVQAYISTNGQSQATQKGLQIINPNIIQASQNQAEDTQANTNENAFIQTDIEKKKKLYADYEAYRLKVGDTIANADYSNLLDSGKDFQTYLLNIQAGIDKTDVSGPIVARLAIVNKALAENGETQQVALQKLTEEYLDYETQREILIGAAQAKQEILLKAGNTVQAGIVYDELKAELALQDSTQAQKIQSATEFTSSLVNLTKAQALVQIQAAKAQNDLAFAQGKISVETFKAVADAIDQATKELSSNQLSNYLNQIGGSLVTLGGDISKTNGNFGALVSAIGSSLTTIKTLSDLSVKLNANGGFIKSLTGADPKDAISVVTQGISSIINLVVTLTSAAATRKQQAEDYYNSVISFQNAYNLSLIQQQQIQYQSDGAIFGTSYIEQINDAVKAYQEASNALNYSEAALAKGEAIVGQKNVVNGKNVASTALSGAGIGAAVGSVVPVIGTVVGGVIGAIGGAIAGLFGGKTKAPTLAPLLAQYPELIDANGKFNESLAKTLVANNQVNDATKVLLNNTINYYDEQQSALDQITSALQSLVGDLGSNLSDSLTTAFENGSDAAVAFQNTVSGVLQNIIQQDLFQAIFGDQLKALQTKLQGDALNGGASTQDEIIADIENFYKTAGASVSEFTAGLQAAKDAGNAQGLTLFPSSSLATQSTLSGGIQASITEDTATILAGTLNGIQLNTFQTNTILESHSLSFGQMISLFQDQLTAILAIQLNTKISADNSGLMVDTLNNISKSSTTSASTALRAAGFYGY